MIKDLPSPEIYSLLGEFVTLRSGGNGIVRLLDELYSRLQAAEGRLAEINSEGLDAAKEIVAQRDAALARVEVLAREKSPPGDEELYQEYCDLKARCNGLEKERTQLRYVTDAYAKHADRAQKTLSKYPRVLGKNLLHGALDVIDELTSRCRDLEKEQEEWRGIWNSNQEQLEFTDNLLVEANKNLRVANEALAKESADYLSTVDEIMVGIGRPVSCPGLLSIAASLVVMTFNELKEELDKWKKAFSVQQAVVEMENARLKNLPTLAKPSTPSEALTTLAGWFAAYYAEDPDDWTAPDCRRLADVAAENEKKLAAVLAVPHMAPYNSWASGDSAAEAGWSYAIRYVRSVAGVPIEGCDNGMKSA